MKTKLILATLLISLALTVSAHADIPRVMNFQGKATKSNGAPITTGVGEAYSIAVSIYDVQEGGTALWTEEHNNVDIKNGIFDILLGSATQKGIELPFDKPYWLGVKVKRNAEPWDAEMTPRTRLASVGYAYTAEEAKHAETVSSISIPFYIQGLELISEDSLHIKVASGAVDIDGRILWNQHFSPNINIQEVSNYIEGCSNPEPWIYVYVYNDNKEIKYILADKAPDKSDYEGNADGTKRYYIHNDVTYRCIGAVRTDTGGKNGALLQFRQYGDWVYWVAEHNFDPATAHDWTPRDLSSAMPRFSQLCLLTIGTWTAGTEMINVYARINGEKDPYIHLALMEMGDNATQVEMPTDTNQTIETKMLYCYHGRFLRVQGFYVGDLR